MARNDVHADVKAAVIAWSQAEDLDDASATLRQARLSLAPELLPVLRREVAEISAETLIELIALERDVVPGEPIEWQGLSLMPRQAERVAAFLQDQIPTAEALGLGPEEWGRKVEQGLRVYVARTQGARATVSEANAKKALALIGRESVAAPPAPKSGGLAGILAARTFKS